MGSEEVNAFLTHLAVKLNVSASTQNQALSALLLLYRELLERDLDLNRLERAYQPKRLPMVITAEDVRAVLQRLQGSDALVAGLLYGSGLRLIEALRLRVHDLDFKRREQTVRNGKDGKDGRTLLPERLSKQLIGRLARVCERFIGGISQKAGAVWCFPQQSRWRNKTTGEQGVITWIRV